MALTPVISPRDPGISTTVKDVVEVSADEHVESSSHKKRKKRKMSASNEDFVSLLASPEECARLLHCFRPSPSSMPSSKDLIFSQSYAEWASFEVQVSSLLLIVVFFLLFLLCLTVLVFYL